MGVLLVLLTALVCVVALAVVGLTTRLLTRLPRHLLGIARERVRSSGGRPARYGRPAREQKPALSGPPAGHAEAPHVARRREGAVGVEDDGREGYGALAHDTVEPQAPLHHLHPLEPDEVLNHGGPAPLVRARHAGGAHGRRPQPLPTGRAAGLKRTALGSYPLFGGG